ncbi:MAG: AAA family ATPase, partial [Acidobacteriota bacterium]
MDAHPEPVDARVSRAAARPSIMALLAAVGSVIRGKADVVRLAAITHLAGGHLLIEDVPGVGKTTLARALARAMGGTFSRVQFTSDLLPADILGVNVFDPATGQFRFRGGPIFCHVLLADEINRTTPRTQSALLQAMEEDQVTLDGTTHRLPQPFLVVATQNPLEHHGTYPLPESQMDRFLIRISMGYPDRGHEKQLIADQVRQHPLDRLESIFTPADLIHARQQAQAVTLDDGLLDYLLLLIDRTRAHPDLSLGASPRASLALSRAARAAAFIDGRDFVVPDDIKHLAEPVLARRLGPPDGADDVAPRRDHVR